MPIDKKRGVIIFLDALGVSKYTQITQFLKYCEDLESFKEETEYIWTSWQLKWIKEDVTLSDPDVAFFQDSLIVCFPEPEKDAESTLHHFFAAQNWLMQAIIMATSKKLFFRGAISNGDYIFNESKRSISVLGNPVVDAYKYEKIGDWIGVIQTPDFQTDYAAALIEYAKINHKPHNEFSQDFLRFYVEYNVPLKEGGFHPCYVVNWPTMVKKSNAEEEIRAALLEGKDSADHKNKPKYDNTLNFLDFCKDNGYFLG
jgi:hypothetical protein